MSEGESTYPAHDCREVLQTHFHNQADANYETCGVCGKITAFNWKRPGGFIQYPCGCTASPLPVPQYCPEHGAP
jgi:hypothetical protein